MTKTALKKSVLAASIGSILFAISIGAYKIVENTNQNKEMKGEGVEVNLLTNEKKKFQPIVSTEENERFIDRKSDGTGRFYPPSDQVVVSFDLTINKSKASTSKIGSLVQALKESPDPSSPVFWEVYGGQMSQLAGHPVRFVKKIDESSFVFKFDFAGSLVKDSRQVIKDRAELAKSIRFNIGNDSLIANADEDIIVFPSVVPEQTQEPVKVEPKAVEKPQDALYSTQWYLKSNSDGETSEYSAIQASKAWATQKGSESVYVAVLDTGITPHPDLDPKLVQGIDLISDSAIAADGNGIDADPTDMGDFITAAESTNPNGPFTNCPVVNSSWHGSHVAGIAGAATSNSEGISGVAWNSKVLPVRVLGKCGGYLTDVAAGVRWAAGAQLNGVPVNKTPAKVINLSLGAPSGTCPFFFRSAINEASRLGSVIVTSAGNNGGDVRGITPANCAGVLSVAAVNKDGDLSFYSNRGSVSISAPGGDSRRDGLEFLINSTVNAGSTVPTGPGYAAYQGTSMAAPLVSGTLALMFSENPGMSSQTAVNALLKGAGEFAPGSTCATSGGCGAGILNVAKAVGEASVAHPDLQVQYIRPLVRAALPSIPFDANVRILNTGTESVRTANTNVVIELLDPGTGEKTELKKMEITGLNMPRNSAFNMRVPFIVIPESKASKEYQLIASVNENKAVYEFNTANNSSVPSVLPVGNDEFAINSRVFLDQAPSLARFDLTHPDQRIMQLMRSRDWTVQWTVPDSMDQRDSKTSTRVRFPNPTEVVVSAKLKHVSGYERTVETPVKLIDARPFDLAVATGFSNRDMKTPINVRVSPRISGGHPDDRVEQFSITVKSAPGNKEAYEVSSNRGPANFLIQSGGSYEVRTFVKSRLGKESESVSQFSVKDNLIPSCQIDQQNDTSRRQIVMVATCSDADGVVRGYSWQINSGITVQGRILRRDYGASPGVMNITFRATDDSQGVFTRNFEVPF